MAGTVLLVDYDPRGIRRIRDLVTALGHHIRVALDGEAGAREFAQHEPDLALVQDLLPKTDGFTLCRRLKATPHGKTTPVVLLTSRYSGRDRGVAACGCDARLEKPFEDAALATIVRRFLPDPVPEAAPRKPATPATKRRFRQVEIPVEFCEEELLSRLDSILGTAADDNEQAPSRGARAEGGASRRRRRRAKSAAKKKTASRRRKKGSAELADC